MKENPFALSLTCTGVKPVAKRKGCLSQAGLSPAHKRDGKAVPPATREAGQDPHQRLTGPAEATARAFPEKHGSPNRTARISHSCPHRSNAERVYYLFPLWEHPHHRSLWPRHLLSQKDPPNPFWDWDCIGLPEIRQ